MRKRLLTVALIIAMLPVGFLALNIIAEIVYDGPITMTLRADDPDEDARAFLQRKLWYLGTEFRYIGYSTRGEWKSDDPIYFEWYEAELPGYVTLGAEAMVQCLAHREDGGSGFDYVEVYWGSPRAIDSQTRGRSGSFHRDD